MRLLLLTLLGVGLLTAPGVAARRKRERTPRATGGKQKDAPREHPRCQGEQGPCDTRLLLKVEAAGEPGHPLSTFRYRLRFGDDQAEGACPPAAAATGPARCVPGGLALAASPPEVDVYIEAPGMRPLLQTLSPEYQPIPDGCGGTCLSAQVRLALEPQKTEAPAPPTP